MNEKKRALIQARRLVLVLDLDHTLLQASELPINFNSVRNRRDRRGQVELIDKLKRKYRIIEWHPRPFSYVVKLRPFCAEFLVQALKNYEIHFNTAATR